MKSSNWIILNYLCGIIEKRGVASENSWKEIFVRKKTRYRIQNKTRTFRLGSKHKAC
jgi:predicted NACHT family NTPase